MNSTKLTLNDAERNECYTVLVSEEDAERAKRDYAFAETLLKNVRETIDSQCDKETPEEESEYSENNDSQKKIWDFYQTLELIAAVESHYDEIHHPQKKKYVWQNISNDLVSKDINVTSTECYKKWQNLLRSYKTSKDLKRKTGRGPSRFQFFSRMDDILGCQPSNCSPHTIDVQHIVQHTIISAKNDAVNESSCSTSEMQQSISRNEHGDLNKAESQTTPKHKRLNLNLDYLNLKKRSVEIKEEQLANKKMKKDESNKLLEKKLLLEERKVKALEKYVQLKEREQNYLDKQLA